MKPLYAHNRAKSRIERNRSYLNTICSQVAFIRIEGVILKALAALGRKILPPDMQKLATETVLKQAEMLANELTGHEARPI